METRKIQQVGGGTYTVSLPKEWATAADIEPGAAVALHTHIDGTLVIQTGTEHREASTPLVLSVGEAEPTALERLLRAAYAAGMGTVELRAAEGFTDDQHRAVERTTRDLTGVTVTETTAETVRVRSLLDAEEVSITQSVRQLQFAALSAHRDATAAVTGPTTVDRPAQRDGQTDRIFAMVDRYFQRGLDSLAVMDALGLTRPALFVRWLTAHELEHVAEHARRIATVADRLDDPVEGDLGAEFESLADRSRQLVREAVALVVDDGDTAVARRILRDRDRLSGAIRDLDQSVFDTADAPYRLTTVLDTLDRTTDSAGRIASMALRSRLHDGLGSETPLDVGGDTNSPSPADTGP